MRDEVLFSKARGIWQTMVTFLSEDSWLQALQKLVSGWEWIKSRNPKGLYQVLDYEIALELRDNKGKKALVSKYEKVRYLQDNVIAFQDQAWGVG